MKIAEASFLSGHVSWDEYKIKFLASKGMNEKEVAEKIKNNKELKIDEESECLSFLNLKAQAGDLPCEFFFF